MLLQEIFLVILRIVLIDGDKLVAMYLVKIWRLKAEGIERHQMTAPPDCFLFCCAKELAAIALLAQVGLDPQEVNLAAATSGIPGDAGYNLLLRVANKANQPLEVIVAGYVDIVLIDLIRQES